MARSTFLPLLLTGPILRHCDCHHFTLNFVTSQALSLDSVVFNAISKHPLTKLNTFELALGKQAFFYQIELAQTDLFTDNQVVSYQVIDAIHGDLFSQIDQLNYQQQAHPQFVIKSKIDKLLHGSCRNPHHHSDDALVAADNNIASLTDIQQRPALIMMSGDQVYVDDIAAPMLSAIGQVINLLGLRDEQFMQAPIASSHDIPYQAATMINRASNLLPRTEYPAKLPLYRWYINHPIFTSSAAQNHLISVAEVIALYLLIWSPELWRLIEIDPQPQGLNQKQLELWQKQLTYINRFVAGLTQVRRLLAHIPSYMIFDDHDVTDDWNLTAKWEYAAYEHPFSKQIIGNALIGYTLFQGLGNQPQNFSQIKPLLSQFFESGQPQEQLQLIEQLFKFEQWHYHLDTSPKLVVLDTRTRRWRSETNLAKPSGLMDWEALMDLQHELIGQDKIIIVSPSPIFGVKAIEAIQRFATFWGASLFVDAENWMAHPGAAEALLSIFLHRKTPQQFVILSGDVHYSFSYDIQIRFRNQSPHIYQITCSGIKNQFPEKLLPIFERINRYLYARRSPLNWFTKRKRMSISTRLPNGHKKPQLVNNSGIGEVSFAENGAPEKILVRHGDGSVTEFIANKP